MLHTTWWSLWQCARKTTRNNTYLSSRGKERERIRRDNTQVKELRQKIVKILPLKKEEEEEKEMLLEEGKNQLRKVKKYKWKSGLYAHVSRGGSQVSDSDGFPAN